LVHRFLKDPYGRAHTLFSLILALVLSCLWFTYSLSGLLAFFLGIAVLLILNHRNYHWKRLSVLLMLIILLVVSRFDMFSLKIQDAFLDFSRENTVSNENIIFSHKLSDPGFIRLNLWKSTVRLIFASPKNFFLGVGPECFPYEFPFFRLNELNYSSEWDYILNKPHNYYLELIAESGVLSLVSYLGILGFGFLKRHPWASGLLVIFLVTNFFSWPTVVLNLFFWFLLGGLLKYEKGY